MRENRTKILSPPVLKHQPHLSIASLSNERLPRLVPKCQSAQLWPAGFLFADLAWQYHTIDVGR
ncbi:hypothetical protein ES703_09378 [subsurface metagenome]